ncbi:mucin-17-like isoform X2 [Anopheles albimanus]|nr:mucin-17-like isoform X2 [Anopheles albimanus]
MNKVEFSDRDIDGDRIDPLIGQSDEEDGLSNEAVNTRTDMNGVEEHDSKDITSVTEITINESTVTLTNGQDMPTQQHQHTVNEANDKNSTEVELDGEITTVSVIPKAEIPPDLKPTVSSLYDNSTKDIKNSESSHVEVSRNVSASDAETATKPVSTESSSIMTQTAVPTERQRETSQSVTTAVSETITNALELTSSLIAPAITDWFRAYSSSEVTDSTEEATKASFSSPTGEFISTVELEEEDTSSSLTTTEEISLPTIDTNAIDTTDNKLSSIEVTREDSNAIFSSSTVSISVTDEPEETLLETTTAKLTDGRESEISETTTMTPPMTMTVVQTNDIEELSASETSTPQVDFELSDITTQIPQEYIRVTTESYIATNHVDDTDPPLTESETIESATITSVIATTTELTVEESNNDITLISSTEAIEATTDTEEEKVSKHYSTTTVGSETSTLTILGTVQPERSALTEGETDSLSSTAYTSLLTTIAVADGIDTTVLTAESSTTISYKAVEDSSAGPVTELESPFQPTTDMIEENDSHTTRKNSNADSMESTDEMDISSTSNNSSSTTLTTDTPADIATVTSTLDIATATFVPSGTEIVTSLEDQQSTTRPSSSILSIESTVQATTFASSIFSSTDPFTLPAEEYTTLKAKQTVEDVEGPDTSSPSTATSSEDLDLTTASLVQLATDVTSSDLPTPAMEQYSISSEHTVDSTTTIESTSKYIEADSSKSTEEQYLTITSTYDTTIAITTLTTITGDDVEVTTFPDASTGISTAFNELKTSTLLASIETNYAADDTATIPVTQGATTFTSSSEEVDTVKATVASQSITTSMSEIAEDIASVATKEMTAGMDLIEDYESTTTSVFPSTVLSTINTSEPKGTAKDILPTEDDSGSYTTVDNEYVNSITTVQSYDEDMPAEETTTVTFTTVATPYLETIDDKHDSTENMARIATSGQRNPTSTVTPKEIPNTEENSTTTAQEFGSTSMEIDSLSLTSISDEEEEVEITPDKLNRTTSPIESVSLDVMEQGVTENTLVAKATADLRNIDETHTTLTVRSSDKHSFISTSLLPITIATSTASPENASTASDRTTPLIMYSHSIASVETIDPSTSMSVNEEEPSLITPENGNGGAASLPTPTILCFVATLTVLTISDNLRLHRRH